MLRTHPAGKKPTNEAAKLVKKYLPAKYQSPLALCHTHTVLTQMECGRHFPKKERPHLFIEIYYDS